MSALTSDTGAPASTFAPDLCRELLGLHLLPGGVRPVDVGQQPVHLAETLNGVRPVAGTKPGACGRPKRHGECHHAEAVPWATDH